ncbi:MAG TPA: hypothetical protein VJG13_06435 [Thermoanaerobaculia bacterium]|nr:hypothetical protein [Thermoanaerobaculia bacterium]
MRVPLGVLSAFVGALFLIQPAIGQPLVRVRPAPGGARAEGGLAEKAAFIVQYDDGEADTAYAAGSTVETFELAMLFEGIGGTDVTLGGVDACMQRFGADPMIRYQVVLWAPDGPGGTPGTELATFAAVATGVTATPVFDGTSLGYPLTTPDVFIGVRYNPVVDPDYFFCADQDGAEVHPGFFRFNEGGAWNSIPGVLDPAYNALMIRASLATPGVFLESLLVPFFLVDRTSPVGTTTLFAVRNLTGDTVSAEVEYLTVTGASQRTDPLTLDPFETVTVNLRDVGGLTASGDGFARGFVEVSTAGNPDLTPVLGGDYFQVDVGDDFATGDQLVRRIELCDRASLRFLEFPLPGSGTRLTVWIANPRGSGGADPVSFTVRVLDESGNVVGGLIGVKTNRHALDFQATDFTGLNFGTLRFDFSNSSGGTVYAEASAQGRFSVGVTSQCDELP